MRFALILFLCSGWAFGALSQSITGWTLVWADEFDQADGTSPNPTKWVNDLGAGGWGNSELEYYTARTNNARIENGQLVIEARKENYQGSSYTSARLKTLGKQSWTYGRVEARIKLPRGQGIWPAFWMLGTNIGSVGWPTCGEIDIMENIGREPTLVHGTIHGPGYSGSNAIGGPASLPDNGVFADAFHLYAIEWTTNQIKWFVDGRQYFSVTPASLPAGANWVFSQPQFILLNLAVGGQWPGNPDGTTVFPQRMVVDYVRVYAPSPLTACASNLLHNEGFEAGLGNWSVYGAGFNTLAETIAAVPVHQGSRAFKVFGQFNGTENYSGLYQDLPAAAGQIFRAGAWANTPANDRLAGLNSAWLEVSFRDHSGNLLDLYRSGNMTSSTPPGAWLNLPVTNQLDPVTYADIRSVSQMVAPARTASVRTQVVLRQPGTAAGAVLFDDLRLVSGLPGENPTPVSAAIQGDRLQLAFATCLGLPYEVRWKADLGDSQWLALTNLVGDGAAQNVSILPQASAAFYCVLRLCDSM